MHLYTNAFHLAAKFTTNEVVLSLLQNYPKYDSDDSIIGTDTESVGSFVMTTDCAKNLAEKINELLSENENAASE